MGCWHAWLFDGQEVSRWSSHDTCPENLPLGGVQWIVEHQTDDRRQHHYGSEYYCWTGSSWVHGERLDPWIRAGYIYPGRVKFGLYAPHDVFDVIRGEAMEHRCAD